MPYGAVRNGTDFKRSHVPPPSDNHLGDPEESLVGMVRCRGAPSFTVVTGALGALPFNIQARFVQSITGNKYQLFGNKLRSSAYFSA